MSSLGNVKHIYACFCLGRKCMINFSFCVCVLTFNVQKELSELLMQVLDLHAWICTTVDQLWFFHSAHLHFFCKYTFKKKPCSTPSLCCTPSFFLSCFIYSHLRASIMVPCILKKNNKYNSVGPPVKNLSPDSDSDFPAAKTSSQKSPKCQRPDLLPQAM